MDNVKIHEPLGNTDHNQIHFDIKVNQKIQIKKYRRNFHKGKYKDTRKYLTKLDWNNMLRNKTAIECWNILKYVIEIITDPFVPLKKQEKALNAATNEIMQSKRSYQQKLACNIKMTARVFMHISGVNKTYETRFVPLEDSNIILFYGGMPKWILQFSVYQRGY